MSSFFKDVHETKWMRVQTITFVIESLDSLENIAIQIKLQIRLLFITFRNGHLNMLIQGYILIPLILSLKKII